jgi:O-antigen/teichoic acid export membrane protein
LLNNIRAITQLDGFKKYFFNTSWLFLEKVTKLVVGLFVGIWVARYLGPEQFGLFSYAQSFVGIFMVLSTLGIDEILIRELVKEESKRDVLLGTSFVIKMFGAFLLFVALFIALMFFDQNHLTQSLIYVIAFSSIFHSFFVIDSFFQAKVLSRFSVYANVITLIISAIVKVLLIVNEFSLIYFAISITFDTAIIAIGYLYYYKRNKLSIFNWRIDWSVAKHLLKNSWPLILSGIVVSMYMKIDQIMIKEMLNTESVGKYAVAVRLSEAWYFIPIVISASLFPSIINSKLYNPEQYHVRLQKLYSLMVLIAYLIAIPMTFLSDFIVGVLYGDAYSGAGSILMIYIWASVFVFLGVSSGKWYLNENLQKMAFYRTFWGLVINVILNYFLIKSLGVIGAAISTLLSQMTAAYFFDLFSNKTINQFVMKTKALLLISVFK